MKGNFRLAKGVLGQGRQNFDRLASENVRSLTALPVDLKIYYERCEVDLTWQFCRFRENWQIKLILMM